MSKWGELKSKIIWPNEFLYAVENEGKENKFGHSYVVKYNGNVAHNIFKKGISQLNKLMNTTKRICENLEEQNDHYNSEDLEFDLDKNNSEEINNANQILLRLNDKKQYFKDRLFQIKTIDEKYDIVNNITPYYHVIRLDSPFVNIEGDNLIEILKKKYSNYYNTTGRVKGEQGKKKRNEPTNREFKTYLYNAKIIDCDETLIGNREFIFSEANTQELKINILINEGKNLQQVLYEYKECCGSAGHDIEAWEGFNGTSERYDSSCHGNVLTSGHVVPNGLTDQAARNQDSFSLSNEMTYEQLGVLPYSGIIMLQKKEFEKQNYVAAFLTPFLLNGNIKKFIENVHPYVKYKFDSQLVLKNLCNLIKLMCYLEEKNIAHGNIKPTNLFISNNGFNILIGNFVPKTKLINYYFYVIDKRRRMPKYISPELLLYLNKKIALIKKRKKTNKHIDKYLIKNDIFCLGLCFYYILTMKEDILNHIDDQYAFQFKLDSIQSFITKPELLFLLKNMLIYEHRQRPTWSALMGLVHHLQGTEKKKTFPC
ncbi:hypothetical protein, conserved [Plasmodium gonderi]|uniref:Protein kinase domain-containing protein n=1 Tax=Plasmodium gonderi TaxID=77519 RepID=A0A1Y1JIC7_PLAGO|nr:hypothetical protein, conserved [Plasmodium gonderi]GAW82256.1 hypothetical protein, conserved [Plasmodium gonderi]